MHAQHVRIVGTLVFGRIGSVALAPAPGAIGERFELLRCEILQHLIVQRGHEHASAICALQHAIEPLARLFAFKCRRATEVGEPEDECQQIVHHRHSERDRRIDCRRESDSRDDEHIRGILAVFERRAKADRRDDSAE